MRTPYRLSAFETAILTIHLIQSYSHEKGRNATRARISQATLRRLAARERLRTALIEEWIDELAALGWSAFPVGDNFAIVETASTDGWPRLATPRIGLELRKIHDGDADEFERIAEQVIADKDGGNGDEE